MTPVPVIDTTLTQQDETDISTAYGVDVDDLQDSVTVEGSRVFGTSKYVEEISQFDLSLGHHFVVLHITAEGADKIEASMDPTKGSGLVELDSSGVVVFQMKDDQSERVKIVVTKDDVSQTAYYDISEMIFEAKTYTEGELTAMTIDQIKALAASLGYTITKSLKADIIEEFLEQQNGA